MLAPCLVMRQPSPVRRRPSSCCRDSRGIKRRTAATALPSPTIFHLNCSCFTTRRPLSTYLLSSPSHLTLPPSCPSLFPAFFTFYGDPKGRHPCLKKSMQLRNELNAIIAVLISEEDEEPISSNEGRTRTPRTGPEGNSALSCQYIGNRGATFRAQTMFDTPGRSLGKLDLLLINSQRRKVV